LFSTFQYYVILNHNYAGENIYEYYYQTILQQKISEINIEHVKSLDIKDLMIVCQENGIDLSGSIEEKQKAVAKKLSYGKSYSKEFPASLHQIINHFIMPLIFASKKNDIYAHLEKSTYFEDESVKNIINILSELNENDLFEIKKEMQLLFLNREDTVEYQSFRKYYLATGNRNKLLSYISELPNFLAKNKEILKCYTYFKFFLLSDFVTMNLKERTDKKHVKK
jgi:hypothetical protein